MKLNCEIGKSTNGEAVYIDFAKSRFVLLVGASGSGKTIFHNKIYRELTSQNTSSEISLIFLDMTRVDFHKWKSPYIVVIEKDPKKAIALMESHAKAISDPRRHTFIHIEECDMFVDADRTENAVRAILENRNDTTLIYSTSRPSPRGPLRETLLSLVDVKVVFELSSNQDLQYILGQQTATMPHRWEKLLVDESGITPTQAFTIDEAAELATFSLF